jgi:hypothetical protein
MNNKLICPFCGCELEDAQIHSSGLYFECPNCYAKQKEKDDNYTATPKVWQELIKLMRKINELVDAVNELQDSLQGVVNNSIKDGARIQNLQELAKKGEKECRFNPVQADREVYKALTRLENVQQVSYTAPGDITVFHGFNCSVEFDIPLPKGTRITIKSITKGGDNE